MRFVTYIFAIIIHFRLVDAECGCKLFKFIYPSKMAICDEKIYSTDKKICCGGTLHDLAENMECCGESAFNKMESICCDDQLHGLPNGTEGIQCCGESPYNEKEAICCDETITQFPINGSRLMACCGGRGYNIMTSVCCYGAVKNGLRC